MKAYNVKVLLGFSKIFSIKKNIASISKLNSEEKLGILFHVIAPLAVMEALPIMPLDYNVNSGFWCMKVKMSNKV